MNVCRQIGAGIQIFACVVLRQMHVHSLFTLETAGFPEWFYF